MFDFGCGQLSRSVPFTIKAKFYRKVKLSIVLEETDQKAFWLESIIDEKLLKKNLVVPLLNEAEELTKIFASSRKSASTTLN